MTVALELGRFVADARFEDLSSQAIEALKVRVVDSMGCALGALGSPPMRLLADQMQDFGGREVCTLVGLGRGAPDRAAFWNGALVRYLDFNDSYLAPGETCHPSDNLAALLAATEYAHGTGRDLLTALAVAYQVQCRLSDAAPMRAKGFDHTTQGSYAVAAGVAKALGLDAERTANAVAIAGTAFNALRVTRTGALSHWKGLAFPNTAFGATHAAFLAMRGLTGPSEVFEGTKGFMDTIAGRFTIDWPREDLERVRRSVLKRYNAEIHSQAAIEAMLELRAEHGLHGEEVERIELDIFDVAYDIIGGGLEGDKTVVRSKEEADHSLPYLLAVALLDGAVLPAQYRPDRILADDVQRLLRRVEVRPAADLSARFPHQHPCRLTIYLRDGRRVHAEKSDYQGFHTRPLSWEQAIEKFHRLGERHATEELRRALVEAVRDLDALTVRDLTELFGNVPSAPLPGG